MHRAFLQCVCLSNAGLEHSRFNLDFENPRRLYNFIFVVNDLFSDQGTHLFYFSIYYICMGKCSFLPAQTVSFQVLVFYFALKKVRPKGPRERLRFYSLKSKKVRLAAYARQLETRDKRYNDVIVECAFWFPH